MKYIIGFLLRITVVVVLVLWLMEAPGTVEINWRNMVINTSAAMLIVLTLAFGYSAVQIHRLWRFLWESPRLWKLKNKLKHLEEGQAELTKGLSAVAASDASQAKAHAHRAKKKLGQTPQTQLLEAQAAQLAGDHEKAKALFAVMATESDTAILGYRGLIMGALRYHDYDEALALAEKLETAKGPLPWLHALRYQISTRQENWPLALSSLEQAKKSRALFGEDADRQESALLLARAKEALRANDPKQALKLSKRAYALTPTWIPACLIYVEAQIVAGKSWSVHRLIHKIWHNTPHPQFIPLLLWEAKADKPLKELKLVQKLVRAKLDDVVSLMALAQASLKADLWGEARHTLLTIEARNLATRGTYDLLARLERRQARDEHSANAWLAKAASAPLDPIWLCSECGQPHQDWEASCSSCGAFNKLEWATPGQAHRVSHKRDALRLIGEL